MAAAATLLNSIEPVQARQFGNFPNMTGTVPMSIQTNYNYDQDGVGDSWVTTMDIEPDITIELIPYPPYLRLYGQMVITSVNDPDPGEDGWFKSTGIFLQELNLTYGVGRWEVSAGKLSPNFGIAADLAPDLFGQDFPGDYSYDEQIGFSGFYTFGDGSYGFHRLSAATFFQDTSIFSESAITNRGRNKTSNGGPGNTGSLESFTVTYDGTGIVFPGGQLDYELGYVLLGKGEGPNDQTSEKGYLAAVAVSFPIVNDALSTLSSGYVEVVPLVEYAWFDDADGIEGQTRDYLTVAVNALAGGWLFGVGYTVRNTDPPGGPDVEDYQYTAQFGYQFINRVQLELGWRAGRESGVKSQTIGLQVSYEYDW
jgi:hypothetical protein